MTDTPQSYETKCPACGASFDALTAAWCECLVSERSVSCPRCGKCSCQASRAYRQQFWAMAPKVMWERKHADSQRAARPEANPEPGQCGRPLVLLVEDEPSIRQVAAGVIRRLGYELVVASTGTEGLELARRYVPDLVLSDALLPGLDGRDMARMIKEDAATGHAKVVVMTSLYTSSKYRNQAFTAHKVDDYLAKPVDVRELRSLLDKHLGPAPAR